MTLIGMAIPICSKQDLDLPSCRIFFEDDEEEIKGDGGARIGELEDLQTQLDELNDRLFNLELAEPGDFFSAAHDRWEAQRDELTDQIQELEDQIALLD